MIPEAKLERVLDRFHAVEAELAGGKADDYARLSKERAELAPLVETINAYKIAARELSGAQALLHDAEPEMRALAEEERAVLQRRLEGEHRLWTYGSVMFSHFKDQLKNVRALFPETSKLIHPNL